MACDYKAIVPYLLDWFDYNARILPWREDPKPYYVWISEIMLQQTRVEAVKGYFDRFIAALPDIEALSEAEEEKLLKLWEGLGYYNRVRNLQRAAKQIMQEYNGEIPADYEKLLRLPGIGEYTAGAIASIAFGIAVPAIDGNVLRVMKRIAGSFDDITRESVKKELRQDIGKIIPENWPGDFNQSLMELGAIVCLPGGEPICSQCPVMHLCKAFREGTVRKLPVKPLKKERRKENRTILLIEYQNRYAIRKRVGKGLLAGLWELPGIDDALSIRELKDTLSAWEVTPAAITGLGEAKHIFSHVEWHMTGYHILLQNNPVSFCRAKSIVWADSEEISKIYSIPSAFMAFTKSIREKKN